MLRQLHYHPVTDARIGEAILAKAKPLLQLLAYLGRHPLEHVGHELRSLAAHTLLQVGRAFERQPGIQREHAFNRLRVILDRRELIWSDSDKAGHHRHPGIPSG